MVEHLMYGLKPNVNLDQIHDNLANWNVGYSFLTDENNNLQKAFHALRMAATSAEEPAASWTRSCSTEFVAAKTISATWMSWFGDSLPLSTFWPSGTRDRDQPGHVGEFSISHQERIRTIRDHTPNDGQLQAQKFD
jgi:hypothetical protein